MQEVLDFISQNQGSLSLLFSFIVTISTVVYAILTWRLVSETQKMREMQIEPKMSIILQPREEWIGLLDLIIQNIGLGPAYDVLFTAEPDFYCDPKRPLSQVGIFQNGLPYLAPNQKYQFFLTSTADRYEELKKNPFFIHVTYKDCRDKMYTDKFYIDFGQFDGMLQLGKPPLHKIARDLEYLQRDIHRLSTGSSRAQVVAYTPEDVERERQQMMSDIYERRALQEKRQMDEKDSHEDA